MHSTAMWLLSELALTATELPACSVERCIDWHQRSLQKSGTQSTRKGSHDHNSGKDQPCFLNEEDLHLSYQLLFVEN